MKVADVTINITIDPAAIRRVVDAHAHACERLAVLQEARAARAAALAAVPLRSGRHIDRVDVPDQSEYVAYIGGEVPYIRPETKGDDGFRRDDDLRVTFGRGCAIADAGRRGGDRRGHRGGHGCVGRGDAEVRRSTGCGGHRR